VGMLISESGKSRTIFNQLKAVLPFLRELAQQTQKITNSAGKYSIFRPNLSNHTFNPVGR
jgi:hypothetical protein